MNTKGATRWFAVPPLGGRRSSISKHKMIRRGHIIWPLLVTLTCVAYWDVQHFEFVHFDDLRYIALNPRVGNGLSWDNIAWAFQFGGEENWNHPLTWLSLMIDAELHGDPSTLSADVAGGFHLTNLFFHVLNVLVLFAAMWQMTGAAWKSGFVAALFAVHPLHVESVAWVAERKDVLSTFFGLLAVLAYAQYVRRFSRGWYALCFTAFLCSLLSKQMLVTLPFVLLLLDYWPLARLRAPAAGEGEAASFLGRLRPLVVEKIPLLLLTAVFSVTAFAAQQAEGTVGTSFSMATRLQNAVVAYALYLWKTVWPAELAVFYPHPEQAIPMLHVLAASIVLAGITCFAWRERRARPYVPVGWFWYLGTLVPVIGLVQIGLQRMADRYTYIPLVGIFLTVAWLVPSLISDRPWRKVVLAVLAVSILGGLTWAAKRQAGVWRNSVTLFEHAIEVTDGNFLAHTNLGVALRELGRRDEAYAHFQEALRIKSNHPEAHNNLGTELQARGRMQEALYHFQQAAHLDSTLAEAHNNLANMLQSHGRFNEAIARYETAIRLEPDNAMAHNNLGNVLQRLGRLDEAIEQFRRAVRIDPRYATAYSNMGNALQLAGRIDEAIEQYGRALDIRPDYAAAYRNLGRAFAAKGDYSQAIENYRRCLHVDPDNPSAKIDFAELLTKLGRLDEAVEHLRDAQQRQPRSARAHLALARAYRLLKRWTLAKDEYQRVLALGASEAAVVHYELGLVYLNLRSNELAARHLGKALELDPQLEAAQEALGRLPEAPAGDSEPENRD